MLLTKSKTFIIGPVATLLGFIMNAIFMFLNGVFSIQNLGLCIILFTVIVYGFMTDEFPIVSLIKCDIL